MDHGQLSKLHCMQGHRKVLFISNRNFLLTPASTYMYIVRTHVHTIICNTAILLVYTFTCMLHSTVKGWSLKEKLDLFSQVLKLSHVSSKPLSVGQVAQVAQVHLIFEY